MRAFNFIIITWGQSHTGLFTDVGLPSLMAPGNLPALSQPDKCVVQLFTTAADHRRIAETPAYNAFAKLLKIELELIDPWLEEGVAPHTLMSRSHRIGLAAAAKRDLYAVFVPPDCVWSDGSFRSLEKIAAPGVRMVHMSGLRLKLEEAKPALVQGWADPSAGRLTISGRELATLGLSHLHPISENSFYHGDSGKLIPANLQWRVGRDGCVARCFHFHPLLIEPHPDNATFETTIDDDLSLKLGQSKFEDYVVTDSDEILAFELSSSKHQVFANYSTGSPAEIAAWAQIGMNAAHRKLVQPTIRLHGSELDPALWGPVEAEAEAVVAEAMRIHDLPSAELARSFPRVLEHRVLAAMYKGGKIADWIAAEGLDESGLPNEVKALLFREQAETRREAGDVMGAIERYSAAIAISPPEVSMLYMRGTLNLEAGALDEGVADLSAALALDPGNATIGYLLSPAHLQGAYAGAADKRRQAGDPAGAVAYYGRAIDLGEPNPTLRYLRGTLLLEIGRIEEAYADFEEGLKIDPGNASFAYLVDAYRGQNAMSAVLARSAAAELAPPGKAAMQRVDLKAAQWGGAYPNLKPWNWRWPLLVDVVRPLAAAVAEGERRTAVFDTAGLPLAPLLEGRAHIEFWTFDKAGVADLQKRLAEGSMQGYQRVVLRSPLDHRDWTAAIAMVAGLVAPGGELALICPASRAAEAKAAIEAEHAALKAEDATTFGQRGTHVTNRLFDMARASSKANRLAERLGPGGAAALAAPYAAVAALASLASRLMKGPAMGAGIETLIRFRKM